MSDKRVAELEAEVKRIGAARFEANEQWQKWAAEATKLQAEVVRLKAKLLAADNKVLAAEMSAATEATLRDLVNEMSAERDRLRADLVAAAIERVSLRAEAEGLRAVLADTPENVEVLGRQLSDRMDDPPSDDYRAWAREVLAALRARVGLP